LAQLTFPHVRLPDCMTLPILVLERLVVTGADEPVYAHAGEDVTLSCSVDTHVNVTELQVKWIKTDDDGDILVLLYNDGENRPELQDGRYSGRAEFFTEGIPKGNFSMKLRKVRTEDKGEFMCEVHSDTDSASTTARIAALGEDPGNSVPYRPYASLAQAFCPIVIRLQGRRLLVGGAGSGILPGERGAPLPTGRDNRGAQRASPHEDRRGSFPFSPVPLLSPAQTGRLRWGCLCVGERLEPLLLHLVDKPLEVCAHFRYRVFFRAR
uniref:Ig-like domain-containing protein n=1 Tax=Paramormyrops kingsleyae TaxID=1676925 RepID=A0A3B3QV41_9TELE